MRCVCLGLVTVIAAGCSVGLDAPKGIIDCSASGACPSGYVCLDIGTCVASDTVCVSGRTAVNEGSPCTTGSYHGICRAGACIDCGDKIIEVGETCDDGNGDDTDDCPSSCLVARCGDGFVHAGVEACDDGNDNNSDGCLNTCAVAACGDGFVDADLGEECDDGNTNANDGCNGCKKTKWQSQVAFGLGPNRSAPLQYVYSDLSAVAEGPNGLIYAAWAATNVFGSFNTSASKQSYATTGGLYGISTAANLTILLSKHTSTNVPDALSELTIARNTLLGAVTSIVPDDFGNLFMTVIAYEQTGYEEGDPVPPASYSEVVLELDATGVLHIVAGGDGQCTASPCGDGGRARDARFTWITSMARDRRGNLYVADSNIVRIIDSDLDIDSLRLTFTGPLSLAVDAQDRLIVADAGAHSVTAIDATGTQTVLASGTCDPASFGTCHGSFVGPTAVAAGDDGSIYVVDGPVASHGDIVEKVSGGTTTNVLGTGALCGAQPCGDDGPATSAATTHIRNIAVTSAGTILVVEAVTFDDPVDVDAPIAGLPHDAGRATRVRAVDPVGNQVTAFAGAIGSAGSTVGNFGTSHEAGSGLVTTEDSGDVLFASGAQVLRWSNTAHTVSLVAGALPACGGGALAATTCQRGSSDATGFHFGAVKDIDEEAGVIYVADSLQVFAITGNAVSPVFGSGVQCAMPVCPENADPLQVSIKAATGIGVAGGHLYVADAQSNAIWDVTLPSGPAKHIAGNGTVGKPSGGTATGSPLGCALDVTAATDGTVYVADADNCAIWQVSSAANTISAAYQGACPGTITKRCGSWSPQPGTFNPDFLPMSIAPFGTDVIIGTDQDVWQLHAGATTQLLGKNNCRASADPLLAEGFAASFECVLTPRVATHGTDRVLVSHIFNVNEHALRDITDHTFHTLVGDLDGTTTGPLSVATLVPGEMVPFGPTSFLSTDASGWVDRVDFATGALDSVVFARSGQLLNGGAPARFVAPLAFDKGGALGIAYDNVGARVFLSSASKVRLAVVDVHDPDAMKWTMSALPSSVLANGAQVLQVGSIAYDSVHGTLYASNRDTNGIFALDLAGATPPRVVAGTPPFVGNSGDGGPATSALLNGPTRIAVSSAGTLYIADTGNNKVRRVRNDGVIETVLGTGIDFNDDDVGMASERSVAAPRGVVFDQFGNLLVTAGPTLHVVFAAGLDEAGEPSGASQSTTIYNASKVAGDRDYINCLSGAFSNSDEVIYAVDQCAAVVMALSQVPGD